MSTIISIAVAARKGGVGKTTTATGIADILASRGLRTALIDLDPQSNAAFALGADPKAPGTADLLLGQSVSPTSVRPGLDVFAGGPELTSHRIEALDPMELRDAVNRLDYQAIIFDCPPGIESLERQATVSSTGALLILDAHPFAIVGARRVYDSIKSRITRGRVAPRHLGVVASRLDLRRSADRELEDLLTVGFPDTTVLRVRQDALLAAATADHRPVSSLPAESRGRADLEAIASWIVHAHQVGLEAKKEDGIP